MTSRERVAAALAHREPDRVPLDLGSTIVTSITRVAYGKLRTYLGLPEEADVRVSHRAMDTVYPAEDLLDRYGVDCRSVHLNGPWRFNTRELPAEEAFYDEFGLKWKKASYYYDVVERPLADVGTVEGLARVAWPDPYDPGRVAGLREEARRLFETTDKALVADIMCLGPFEGACFLRGYDLFCMDLYDNRGYAEALLDKITDTAIQLWEVFLDAVGDYVQVAAQGDDVGMQTGTIISPEMYREFIKPRHERLFTFIHSRTKARTFLHSCGSVVDVIPDLIDAGVDILNPVQRSAARMDIRSLKSEYGRDLVFWGGGIDVQQVLPFASPAEIEREVEYSMETLGEGGGYVFVASHNIQADVSPERVDALYRAAGKSRGR